MTRFTGRLSIHRASFAPKDIPPVSIILRDDASSTECIEIFMTPEALGEALLGRGEQPCIFLDRTEHVGETYETEVVTLLQPLPLYGDEHDVKRELLNTLQNDPSWADDPPWHYEEKDITNHHNWRWDAASRQWELSIRRHRWLPAQPDTRSA